VGGRRLGRAVVDDGARAIRPGRVPRARLDLWRVRVARHLEAARRREQVSNYFVIDLLLVRIVLWGFRSGLYINRTPELAADNLPSW
jgi:hypothetical protein